MTAMTRGLRTLHRRLPWKMCTETTQGCYLPPKARPGAQLRCSGEEVKVAPLSCSLCPGVPLRMKTLARWLAPAFARNAGGGGQNTLLGRQPPSSSPSLKSDFQPPRNAKPAAREHWRGCFHDRTVNTSPNTGTSPQLGGGLVPLCCIFSSFFLSPSISLSLLPRCELL